MDKENIACVVVIIIVLCSISFVIGRSYERTKNAKIVCMKAMNGNFSYWVGDDIVCNKGGVDYKIGYKRAKKFTL